MVNIKKLKQQAKQGDISAQYNLSHIYFYGDGAEKNEEEALNFAKKAADQGHKEARVLANLIMDFDDPDWYLDDNIEEDSFYCQECAYLDRLDKVCIHFDN